MPDNVDRHRDGELAADLFAEEQRRAIKAYAEKYHPNRPPLTSEERRAREGNVTLPATPEMRAAFAPPSALNTSIVALVPAVIVWLAIKLYLVNQLNLDLPVPLLIATVLAVAVYSGVSRLYRWNISRLAGKVQSFDRYAGPLTIKERAVYVSWGSGTGYNRYTYTISLPSPPARIPELSFYFRPAGKDRDREVCTLTWGTVEYFGKQVLSLRNDCDQEIYQDTVDMQIHDSGV